MRGFRWQALALVLAVAVFGLAWLNRQPSPTPLPEPTPQPTNTPAPTLAPTAANVLSTSTPPLATPLATLPTFREALIGNVRRINPLLRGTNPAEDTVSALIYEGLVRTNQYGEPEPALATEWIIANNQIEYVFRLRDDVRWQDGTPFTAQDVAFTMALLRDPDYPGDPEVGAFWRTVETEVLADDLVRFRLTQPLGSFLDALRIGILPEHALRGMDAADLLTHPFNLSPVGTGPYQLEAIRTTNGDQIETIDLRRAPVYAQRPEGQTGYAIERVRFHIYPSFDPALTAFNARQIDGLAAPSSAQRPALLAQVTAPIYTNLEPTLGVLIFNWRPPDTDDAPPNSFREDRVRRALALSLNRRAIVERNLLNRAIPANNPLMPGVWAYDTDIGLPPPDVEQAAQLLADANLPGASDDDADDAPVLAFTLLVPDTPERASLAQEIAEQWSQLNINATVEAVAPATYRQRLADGAFDVALVELSLGKSADPDVYSFWHQGQFPDGNNYGAVDDRRISETLERARRDPYGLNRKLHYQQFQQEFVNRAIAIPLYYPLYTYTIQPQITGVQLGFIGEPADRLRNIADWVIQPE